MLHRFISQEKLKIFKFFSSRPPFGESTSTFSKVCVSILQSCFLLKYWKREKGPVVKVVISGSHAFVKCLVIFCKEKKKNDFL